MQMQGRTLCAGDNAIRVALHAVQKAAGNTLIGDLIAQLSRSFILISLNSNSYVCNVCSAAAGSSEPFSIAHKFS